jgi:hydrogenase/urease accessory protein HupE
MNRSKWWMRVVGVVYILLGLQKLPFIFAQGLSSQYPALTATPDSTAFKALVDTWFLFGIEIAVIGIFLILASREPLKNVLLVQLVLVLEVTRGIAHDIYAIMRGESVIGVLIGFIILHLVIFGTGLAFYPRGETVEST